MNRENDIINDWKPEVRSFLRTLVEAGFQLVSADNGEETVKFDGRNHAALIENLVACDEGWLTASLANKYVVGARPHNVRFYLLLGNSPGELVADYAYNNAIEEECDAVTSAHADKWEGRKQPTTTWGAVYGKK